MSCTVAGYGRRSRQTCCSLPCSCTIPNLPADIATRRGQTISAFEAHTGWWSPHHRTIAGVESLPDPSQRTIAGREAPDARSLDTFREAMAYFRAPQVMDALHTSVVAHDNMGLMGRDSVQQQHCSAWKPSRIDAHRRSQNQRR